MEFVISRAALCIGGVILLAAAAGTVSGIYDTDVGDVDGELAVRIAGMLDAFESSQTDVLILEGPVMLPNGRSISVHDNVVELHCGESVHNAVTRYAGEFRMDCTETVEITRRTSPLSS